MKKGLYVKRDKDGKEVTGVWDIHLQAEDVVTRSPDIYLCHHDEEMLYHWSGREAGVLASGAQDLFDMSQLKIPQFPLYANLFRLI